MTDITTLLCSFLVNHPLLTNTSVSVLFNLVLEWGYQLLTFIQIQFSRNFKGMNRTPLRPSTKKDALLKWINSFNPQTPLESLESLPKHPVLLSILSLIDPDFNCLNPESLNILQTCLHLSKYMVLKLNFRGIITSHCDSVDSMTSQLLYVCVHCDKKEDFITQILTLQTSTQSILMRIISQTSVSFQKHKEIKQVLEKVEQLELENEELKMQIEKNEREFERYDAEIRDLKNEMRGVVEENMGLVKEKVDALKELNITEFDQYLELYKRLNSEYEDLDSAFKKLSEMHQKQKTENEEYKKKIIEDSHFIYFLSNQSEQARAKWQTLKSIYSNNPPDNIYDLDINTPSPLSPKCTNIPPSLHPTNDQNQPPKKQEKQKPTQFIQTTILQAKGENMRLIEESQRLFQKCEKYKRVVAGLKVRNNGLESCNEFLMKKISDMEFVYEGLRTRYPA